MIRLLILLILFSEPLLGQVYMKLGFTAGPNFSFPSKGSDLSEGFFKVSRTSFQGGVCNSVQAGEHFFSKISLLFSRQVFSIRQTGNRNFTTKINFHFSQIEVPLVAGTSGFFGTLRHREYIGLAISNRIGKKEMIDLSGDSSSLIKPNIETTRTLSLHPLLLAGFEIGTTFKNDASLYFGALFRYGLQPIFSAKFSSDVFPVQYPEFRGTYAGLEVTFYLPRFSYWIRKEFTY